MHGREPAGGRPAMPWMLNQIVARCLAKNPGRPVPDRGDLGQALRWMAESGAQTGTPALAFAVARLAQSTRRLDRPWVVAIIAALAAAMKF